MCVYINTKCSKHGAILCNFIATHKWIISQCCYPLILFKRFHFDLNIHLFELRLQHNCHLYTTKVQNTSQKSACVVRNFCKLS